VEVQLSLVVSELTWEQKEGGGILDYLELESLDVLAFDRIEIPQTRDAPAEILTEPQAHFRIAQGQSGQISLDPIHAGAGTVVSISRSRDEPLLGVSLRGESPQININLGGTISIAAGGRQSGQRDFGRSRPVRVESGQPNTLYLSLRFPPDRDVAFAPHIAVAALSLQQVRDVVVEGLRTPRSVSTVLGGEIFNESLNGRQYPLRRGQWLSLDGIDGEIRSMELAPQGIQFDFHGTVADIRVGSSSNQRSLMPSWLEWIAERHSVKLLWGSFFWLLTTVFGVIKWWNRSG
jgi:hypothetical protein